MTGALDVTRPSMARVLDALSGGKDNFAADRALAAALMAEYPGMARVARSHREFMLKAAARLAGERGIRQFIVIGAGLPTCRPFVHEVAREAAGSPVRAAYVEDDPHVLLHIGVRKAAGPGLAAVPGTPGDPRRVLASPELLEVIDLGEPAAVLLGGVLITLSAQKAREAVAGYTAPLAAGSAAMISCTHWQDRRLAARIAAHYSPAKLRNHDLRGVRSFLAGAGLEIAGAVTDVSLWPQSEDVQVYGGTAMKRGLGPAAPRHRDLLPVQHEDR